VNLSTTPKNVTALPCEMPLFIWLELYNFPKNGWLGKLLWLCCITKNEFKINIMETLNWVLSVIQLKFTTVPYDLAYNTICNLDNTIPKLTCNNYFSELLKVDGLHFPGVVDNFKTTHSMSYFSRIQCNKIIKNQFIWLSYSKQEGHHFLKTWCTVDTTLTIKTVSS